MLGIYKRAKSLDEFFNSTDGCVSIYFECRRQIANKVVGAIMETFGITEDCKIIHNFNVNLIGNSNGRKSRNGKIRYAYKITSLSEPEYQRAFYDGKLREAVRNLGEILMERIKREHRRTVELL